MFILYTLIYFVILYLGPTITIISPSGMKIFSILRETYLIFVFFYLFYSISFQKKIFLSKENILFTLCCLLALPYITQAGLGRGVLIYILFFSGPFLFIAISNLKFSEKTMKNYHFFVYLFFLFTCIGGILLFFFQNKIVNIFGYENFKMFYYQDGSERMRLFGLGFHTTTSGFLYIYAAGYLFYYKRKKIASFICFLGSWLSHTRSALFGIPASIFFRLKKRFRMFLIIPVILLLFFVYKMFMNKTIYKYLDGSSFVHFLHLFVDGPLALIEYPFGVGLGMVSPYSPPPFVIHLESDLYLYSIQVGILNLILYISAIVVIFRKLLKDNTDEAQYLIFIILTFMLGCIIFPLHTLRFTSNFVFIEMGFYFSKRNYYVRGGTCSQS